MAITEVQSKSDASTGAASNSFALTLDSSTTNGNHITIDVSSYGATQSASTVTDNKGNTWTRAGSVRRSHQDDTLEQWYANNITGGAGHQITVTMANVENIGIAALEYAGIATSSFLDNASFGVSASNGTAANASGLTPSQANCVIHVSGTDQILTDFSTAPVTANTGFTLEQGHGTADNSVRIYNENEIQTTATARTPGFTLPSSSSWAVIAQAYRAASGGTIGAPGTASIVISTSGILTIPLRTPGTASIVITVSGQCGILVPVSGTANIAITTAAQAYLLWKTTGTASIAITTSGTVLHIWQKPGIATISITTSGTVKLILGAPGTSLIVVTVAGLALMNPLFLSGLIEIIITAFANASGGRTPDVTSVDFWKRKISSFKGITAYDIHYPAKSAGLNMFKSKGDIDNV